MSTELPNGVTVLDNEKKGLALAYAKRGWPVFPCRPNQKRPHTKHGFQDASSDASQVNKWWSKYPVDNVAVATGREAGIVVIDIDIAEGKLGRESAEKLGILGTQTYIVQTWSGGWHYYFKLPNAGHYTSRNGLLPGIDIRADGGYVMAAGSVIDDSPYKVVCDVEPVELPPHMVEILSKPRAPSSSAVSHTPALPPIALDDDDGAIVASMLEVISPDCDYATWINVGMSLHELHGGSDEGFEVFDDWSSKGAKYQANQAGETRRKWLSFQTTRPDRITESTLYYTAVGAGWTPPASGLTINPDTFGKDAAMHALTRPPEASGARFSFTIAELMAWEAPKLSEIELWRETIISRGSMTLLAGPPKIGKSMMVIDMMLCAACGADFLGHQFSKPLKIFWAQAELRKMYMREGRILPAMARFTEDQKRLIAQNFHTTDRLDLEITSPDEFKAIAKEIKRIEPDILVIDPVINFSSANENDAQETKALLRAARRLSQSASAEPEKEPALVIVHHTRKIDPKRGLAGQDPFDMIRGSGAFRGYYDAGIMMLPDPSGSIGLHFEARNQAPVDPMGVRFDGESAQFVAENLDIQKDESGQFSAIRDVDTDAQTAAIIQFLAGLHEPYFCSASELCTAIENMFNIKSRQAKHKISTATNTAQGSILRAGGGKNTVYYHASNAAHVEPFLATTFTNNQ